MPRVGRYSVIGAVPTEAQADLLATTLTIRFPERIQSLVEAVRYLLQRSGLPAGSMPNRWVRRRQTCLRYRSPAVHRSLDR